MERIEAGDVLQVIRARVDELERERDESKARMSSLQRERDFWRMRCWKVEQSRASWREKAKERRRKVYALQWKLAWSDPNHPLHGSRVAA